MLPRGICDNLRFLTAETASQVSTLHSAIESSSLPLAQRIVDRAGYAANLQRRIHDSALRLIGDSDADSAEVATLRAAQTTATELDRITALCRECVRQIGYMQRIRHLRADDYGPLLDKVVRAIGCIDEAVASCDTHLALRIGKVERRLDQAYRRLLKVYGRDLTRRQRVDMIPALFVARAVEQMGDALLAISEAIISANLGQPFDTGRYKSLKTAVARLDGGPAMSGVDIESVAETRSGSDISAISNDRNEPVGIFKDGLKRKLREERQGVESWHQVFPGIAPRILSYHKQGRSAALLIEHLAGQTFEHILVDESTDLLHEALERLTRTLKKVWKETRSRKPVPACFMAQLSKRIDEVCRLHPEFMLPPSSICTLELPGLQQLIDRAAVLERELKAPFSVYIHGDFNIDNIIYDPDERRINFVDLHRSQYMDYVQDVSVFMVSNYRLQVLTRRRRRRAMALVLAFYRFAAQFARRHGDDSFELRLALGLARSFITSTRFILDPALARAMFLRGRFLLELALSAGHKKPKGFRIPIEEVFSV